MHVDISDSFQLKIEKLRFGRSSFENTYYMPLRYHTNYER